MARQRRRIIPLLRRLYVSRATRYQHICLQLARLIPDLPYPQREGTLRGPATLLRHTEGLPASPLNRWLDAVLGENVLAGMVLVDALHYIYECLEMVAPGSIPSFPDREAKAAVTSSARQLYVEFQVPPGWELRLGEVVQQAGFSGVARVERCHLSSDASWSSRGEGRLVGQAGLWLEQTIGFSIPCVYFSHLHLEDTNLVDETRKGSEGPAEAPAERRLVPGTPVKLPYAFVRQAFRWEMRNPVELFARSSPDEVLELARAARERLRPGAQQE